MAMAGISTACVSRCSASGEALAGNENCLKSRREEKARISDGYQLHPRKVGSGRWSVCGRVYYNTSIFRSFSKERKTTSLSQPSPSVFSPPPPPSSSPSPSPSPSPWPSPSSSSSPFSSWTSSNQAGKVGRVWKRNSTFFSSSPSNSTFLSSSPSNSTWFLSSPSPSPPPPPPPSSSPLSSSCDCSWSSSSSLSYLQSPGAFSRWPRVCREESWPAGNGGVVGAASAASPSAADSVLTDVERIDSGVVVGEVEMVGEPLSGGKLNLTEEANEEDGSAVGNSRGIDYQRDYFTAANRRRSQGTIAVHAGERAGRPDISDSLTTPLVQTATYTFRNTAEVIAYQEGQRSSYEYGRYGNPTTRVLEKKISALEGAEDTLVFASGMCAATTMLFALVPKNGHIVTTTDCYRRTRQFIQTFLHKLGITTTVIDPADMSALEKALHENQVSLFFSESPTNPYLRCIDIQRVADLCHNKGALVCIDGTFATPVNQRSIRLGADIVIHSGTKYLAGHNDVLAGSLSGTVDLVGQVRYLHNILGGVIDPHAAYLILRGIKTLELRVRRQNESAMRIARELESHPKILRVHYPGLESHPEHGIAVRQMDGFGGVVSFEINGDLEKTSQFIDNLKLPYIAPSLGGVESLVEQPTVISYWDQSPIERARLGIKDNLVRYSCGIEYCDDILQDILRSLDSL